MAKLKRSKERGRKERSRYFQVYNNFKNDIFILNELNKQLPKSIKEFVDKRQKKYHDKLTKLDKKSKKEIRKIADLFGKVIKDKKKSFSVSVGENAAKLFTEVMHSSLFSSRFNMFIRDMSLVYLIAEFESFVKHIMEISFEKKPEILIASHKTIEFKDLFKLKDIQEAKQNLVEKETNAIINQDIILINKYFKDKFNLDLSKEDYWNKFKERFYRRNVLLHNSGHVNKIYKSKTHYRGKNTRLTVSQKYLKDSLKLFERVGLDISEHFYKKIK